MKGLRSRALTRRLGRGRARFAATPELTGQSAFLPERAPGYRGSKSGVSPHRWAYVEIYRNSQSKAYAKSGEGHGNGKTRPDDRPPRAPRWTLKRNVVPGSTGRGWHRDSQGFEPARNSVGQRRGTSDRRIGRLPPGRDTTPGNSGATTPHKRPPLCHYEEIPTRRCKCPGTEGSLNFPGSGAQLSRKMLRRVTRAARLESGRKRDQHPNT